MITKYPKEFIDYVQNEYGLECVDYQNEQCFKEWCRMTNKSKFRSKVEKVRLYFPNIDKEFVYCYPHDMEQNRVEQTMRQWYDEQADLFFALYGYGPMDVSVTLDGNEVASYKACYQETLWHSFFREGGESWHGRFSHFELSLIECRRRNEECEQRELKKAA